MDAPIVAPMDAPIGVKRGGGDPIEEEESESVDASLRDLKLCWGGAKDTASPLSLPSDKYSKRIIVIISRNYLQFFFKLRVVAENGRPDCKFQTDREI